MNKNKKQPTMHNFIVLELKKKILKKFENFYHNNEFIRIEVNNESIQTNSTEHIK